MKKNSIRIFSLFLCLVLAFSLFACASSGKEDLWENALYQNDTELGEGKTCITLGVKAGEKEIKFTLHTDGENLEQALREFQLVEGEESEFGLYVKKVNGILADYEENGAYWALSENGESSMTGASGISVTEGGEYLFVYTK